MKPERQQDSRRLNNRFKNFDKIFDTYEALGKFASRKSAKIFCSKA